MATKSGTGVSATKSNFGKQGWGIIALSFFSILLMSSIAYDSLNVTINVFAASRGWNVGLLYMFSTVAAWISVVGAALWGAVCSKKTCRLAWVLSLVCAAVACFLWGFAGSIPVYFLCLALANVGGMGFAYIAGLNVISNWFPHKKGLAMGWVTIGFPLSATFTTVLCSGLMGVGGLPAIYLFYGAACVVLAILVAVFVRDYPEERGAFPDNDKSFNTEEAQRQFQAGMAYMKTSPWTPKRLFRTKAVWMVAFSLGVMELLSLGIMTNFMPRMLQIGFQQQEVIPMLMIAGLIACVGSYACGLLDAKFGPKRATVITLAVGILSIALNIVGGNLRLAGDAGLSTILLYISLPFLGFMLGGAANYLVSLTNTIWGRYDFPMAYRILKPMVAIIGAVGITICGGVGNAPGLGYGVAYTILGVLGVLALIVIVFVDDKLIGRDL